MCLKYCEHWNKEIYLFNKTNTVWSHNKYFCGCTSVTSPCWTADKQARPRKRAELQNQVSNMNHCRLVGKNGELRVRTENASPRNFKVERTIMSCTGATCPATLAQPLVRRERCEPWLDRAHPGVCLFDKSLHPLHMFVGHLDGLLLDLAGLRLCLLLRWKLEWHPLRRQYSKYRLRSLFVKIGTLPSGNVACEGFLQDLQRVPHLPQWNCEA